jgi:hypothetical protein
MRKIIFAALLCSTAAHAEVLNRASSGSESNSASEANASASLNSTIGVTTNIIFANPLPPVLHERLGAGECNHDFLVPTANGGTKTITMIACEPLQ